MQSCAWPANGEEKKNAATFAMRYATMTEYFQMILLGMIVVFMVHSFVCHSFGFFYSLYC
jgi:hypothetical protein